MNGKHNGFILKAAIIAALGFTAISCVWTFGSIGAAENAELIAAFGRGRYPLAGLLAWLIWIIVNRERKTLTWVYAAVAFLFAGASLCVLQHGGYGYVPAWVALKAVHYVDVAGLYFGTLTICAAPFLYRKRRAMGRSLAGRAQGFQGFFENTIKPELENFKLFVDVEEKDDDGAEESGCPASCQPLQDLFDANKVNATVVDTREANNTLQYIIQLGPGGLISKIERLRPEIAMELNTSPQNISVSSENRRVVVSVNKQERQIAEFDSLQRDKAFMQDKSLIPIGITESSRPLHARLDTNMPHLLVVGTTRSGKTTFLQALIAAMALKYSPDDLEIMLIAGTSDGFVPFVGLPHLAGKILYDVDEIEQGLAEAVEEMDRRARIHRTDIHAPFHKFVIVIDEIDGIIAKAGKGVYGIAARLITRLAKESGKYNMSLVLGAQKPTGDVIPAGVLSNITNRVCLLVASGKFSRQIIDAPNAAQLSGKGDLYYYSGGQLTRCQGYYLPSDSIQTITKRFAGQPKRKPLRGGDTAASCERSTVKSNIYRYPTAGWMETWETEKSPTPTQYYKKSPPPVGNRQETRVETETETLETYNTPLVGTVEGDGRPETETCGDTPEDIIRMYDSGQYTMREIAKMIGRSPKYVCTVLHKRRGDGAAACVG